MKSQYLLLLLAFLVAVSLGNARAVPNPNAITEGLDIEVAKREYTDVKSWRNEPSISLPRNLGAPGTGHEYSTIAARGPVIPKKKTATTRKTAHTRPGGVRKSAVVRKPTTVQKPQTRRKPKKPIVCPVRNKPGTITPGGTNKTPTTPTTPKGGRLAQRGLAEDQQFYTQMDTKIQAKADKFTLAQLSTTFTTGQYTDAAGNEPSLQASVLKLMGLKSSDTFDSRLTSNARDPFTGAGGKGMKYIDSYHAAKGAIVVQDVNNGKNPIASYPLRLTDILSKEWQEACAAAGVSPSSLRWVLHDTIVHEQTEALLDKFQEHVSCDESIPKVAGLYKLTYENPTTKEWFLKFYASGNGKPTAYFAADYAKLLGGKKVIAVHVDLDGYGCVFEFGK